MARLAVITDIHSAAGAYSAALDAARAEGFDMLVLLGDLLTYGPFPERTLEITSEAVTRHDTVLIQGNHDQIYLQAAGGGAGAQPHKGGWINESIDWTLERIEPRAFAQLAWRNEFVLEGLLFAHANPFAFGDWSYLRTDEDFGSAVSALRARGLKNGIFGHSHRHARFRERDVAAMTIGSVGQPRSRTDKAPQWAMVTLESGLVDVELRSIEFDWQTHCDDIRSTSLSDSTKDRLCEFFL